MTALFAVLAIMVQFLLPVVVVAGAFWLFLRTPTGRALRDRILSPPDTLSLHSLLTEVDDLRREVAELQERVDFHERSLAQLASGVPFSTPIRSEGSATSREPSGPAAAE